MAHSFTKRRFWDFEVEALVALAREQGYVLYIDLMDVVNPELNPEKHRCVEVLAAVFEEIGFRVLDTHPGMPHRD
ncbi:hypothetical protein QTQ03_29605 [Micromonospora sp. WMMA1363]|uniref:hypothetical protein n=1 Tax=Micromonospora sp. WMMA1363 TaxID=3053985 RepID=UPI00259D308E|nr:hypothetical protein [Micromonospora sp. WMMA1363]MDM4723530.1 hypothetical protein [Micromonospora sp. WMMA1363]